ncbi:MAG TPA: dihydrodipicolinate synthase family protein [Gemmatimonadales bacterium]|nr:dihydrodipicolinate synthase family protein [Gemmatimonadales bacterium]
MGRSDRLARIRRGLVIPAHPLALTPSRKLDERRQRALTRYYVDAGAGGVAIGVHTTQFAIRTRGIDLLRPVLELAVETIAEWKPKTAGSIAKIAGVVGRRSQALVEARVAADLGYDAGLLSMGALTEASDLALVEHARAVAEVIPVMGFYLQPAVGGRVLSYRFWRRFLEIENVVAIKVAPFNRYATLDVCRAVADSARRDVALYTGNDDNIVGDLVTPHRFMRSDGRRVTVRMTGGLLGHWAYWTRNAVRLHADAGRIGQIGRMLRLGIETTDANAAIFDAVNSFHGCIPGIHEVLRRQGLLRGRWCLDPAEELSPGQMKEIDRVWRSYPHLRDDDFVRERLDAWMS